MPRRPGMRRVTPTVIPLAEQYLSPPINCLAKQIWRILRAPMSLNTLLHPPGRIIRPRFRNAAWHCRLPPRCLAAREPGCPTTEGSNLTVSKSGLAEVKAFTSMPLSAVTALGGQTTYA